MNAQRLSDELSSVYYVGRAVGFTLDQTVTGRLLWLCRTTLVFIISSTQMLDTIAPFISALRVYVPLSTTGTSLKEAWFLVSKNRHGSTLCYNTGGRLNEY